CIRRWSGRPARSPTPAARSRSSPPSTSSPARGCSVAQRTSETSSGSSRRRRSTRLKSRSGSPASAAKRSGWISGGDRGQPPEGGIVLADEPGDRLDGGVDVLRRCQRYLLDVAPISRPGEKRLEDDQRRAVEDRDLRPLHVDPEDAVRDLLVERQVVEEYVDRHPVPEEPGLPLTDHRLDIALADPHPLRERRQNLRRPVGVDEDVDVEIAGPTWLLNAVGESDGAAEGVRKRMPLQGRVDREELFDQLGVHAGAPLAIRSFSGG